jgi:phage baseplate assembly protein gpV
MSPLENMMHRSHERSMIAHLNERHGLVTSYDPKTHLAKVTFMPEGEESTWLPIEVDQMGNGWGVMSGLTPGSGQPNGQGGAASTSSGAPSSSGGAAQYQGDQVVVRYQEGDLESGKIVRKVHSDTDKPPAVQSGEMLWMHSLGARLFIDKAGHLHIYDRTSNQTDQSQSGGGAGAAGQGMPLKNAPPLQPQSTHIELDGSGKITISSFQQTGRAQGQDPEDPTSQKSPAPYATHTIDGKNNTVTTTTYQKQQSAPPSGGGGGTGPDTVQGSPGSEAQASTVHPFSTMTVDGNAKTFSMQTYQDGSSNPMHSLTMDNTKGTITQQTYQPGGNTPASSISMDIKGNIAHKCTGVMSVHAPNFHFNGNVNINGNLNTTNNVTVGNTLAAAKTAPSPQGSASAFDPGSNSPLEV